MKKNVTEYSNVVDEETAEKELRKSIKSAEKVISDPKKIDEILQRAEKKLQGIKIGKVKVGEVLSNIPTMIELIKDYFAKNYTKIPIGSILAVVGVIIYFVAPVDLIPDWIPVAGYLDDAAVCVAALKLVGDDIQEYRAWRKENGREIVDFDETEGAV